MVIKSDDAVGDTLATSPCTETDGRGVIDSSNASRSAAVSIENSKEKNNSCSNGRVEFCSANANATADETQSSANLVRYGELVILGYNGHLASGDRGRRRSKFILYRRNTPNGVKRSRHYVVRTPTSTQAILNTEQHSISYTMSRNQAVIVEYTHDDSTDMFQIGRSSESPIDFVVLDTVAGDKNAKTNAGVSSSGGGGIGSSGSESTAANAKVMASTISRFACRILCDRTNPSIARIFAAGFDSSKNIFLGEKGTKWETGADMDGLTTNGVLIMHPNGCFSEGNAQPGIWREVSIGGAIYSLRISRSSPVKGSAVDEVSNVLQDGTLIDLCGATLLWRTAEGLKKSPTKEYLEELVDQLNANRPVCPVGLNTLVIPRRSGLDTYNQQQPYVYLSCGHVQGHHDWGLNKESNFRTCPMCLKVGRAVKLCMGIEPAFYVDCRPPPVFFAFDPCGHMATEKTVKYWAQVSIPHGTNGFEAFCPFCATLLEGDPGYVRLIFN